MSSLLLWIEILAAFLLLAALHFAYSVRATVSGWRKLLLGIVVVGVLIFPLAGLVVATAYLKFGPHLGDAAFWWSAELWVACLIGTLLVRRRAMKEDDAGTQRGVNWSPRRLAETLGIVMLILVMTLWNLTLQTQIEVQSLRTRAGALALAASPPRVPESEDAGPLYAQLEAGHAAASLPEDDQADYEHMDASAPQLVAYLQRQERRLELARRAADLAGYNGQSFDTDLLASMLERDLSHLGTFREAAMLLSVAARHEAVTGQVDLAIEDCRRIRAVGNHVLGRSSMLVGGLVHVAIDGIASRTAAEVLPFVTTRDQVERIKIENPDEPWGAYAQCLQMDEALGIATVCDVASGEGQFKRMPAALGALNWELWLREDCGIYRDYMDQSQKMTREPYSDNAATRATWEDSYSKNHRGLLSAILLPSLVAVSRQVATAEVLRLSVNEACDATRYRLDHGDYPDSPKALLSGFKAAIPTDPFDGRRLRYKKRDDGSIVIYSVGANAKDDGGDVEKNGSKSPADIGVILRLPPTTKP